MEGAADMVDTIVAFRLPPVVEVVAGVAFDARSNEVAPLLAAFWKERLRSAFPAVQQQPPYSPPIEQLDDTGSRVPFEFSIDLGFPSPRLWAMSATGHEVLQLQPGWFACNWRRVKPEDEYDRWAQRRAAFERWFNELVTFMDAEGVKPLQLTQCEVTYINHIRPNSKWEDHGDFSRVFSMVVPDIPAAQPEQLTLQSDHVFQSDGKRFGRLHVKILPAFERDGVTPIYVLELTARGAPSAYDISGALAFMDAGRAAIDHAFVALTSEAMHREWGREA
jgi:uncharacterized protein (TIGR04255 family)